ncbi:Uncharacterized protein FWK35_00028038 [Aphis craccivora]|uniref:Reverse transcriptase domain-containing protein n=1 Tax=Aphis craccivora TaxID=307492 RepID=A0A6G0W9N0_APHCR|nr:Uncharacterized protein FWK35_00028038 [Aphis craccivora]
MYSKTINLSDRLLWRCTVKSCTSSVCSDESVTILLTFNLHHNHKKSANINKQIVVNSLKRKAMYQITTRPLKLIRNEMQSSVVGLTLKDVNSIKRSVYRSRRKTLPPLPKNLPEVHSALTNLDTSTISTYKGKNILLISDSILNKICFSTGAVVEEYYNKTTIETDKDKMEYRTPHELSFSGNVAQNWKEWYQQFNIYLIASNKDEENDIRKINILLNLIGPQGVKIYNNFKKKEKTNFDTVVRAFNQYCEPRKNIIFQRYKFGCCIQQEGKSFDDFLTELKTLAATCEYKEEDNMIRDRIVFGVKDPEIKDKLLTISNLSMDKAEEICKTTEATKQELQEMATSSEVHMVKRKTTDNGKGKNLTKTNNNKYGVYKKSDGDKNNEYNCKKCGRKHKPRECFAFGKMCSICKKMNHFAIGCKSKNKEEEKEVYETHYGEEEMFQIDTIYNVHQINSNWTKTIRVVTLILFRGNISPHLRANKCNVESYGGHKIESLGKCQIKCMISPKCIDNVEFLILKPSQQQKCQNIIPILGLESCVKYDLIKRVDMIGSGKELFIKNNFDVFTGLGKFPELYEIQLKDNAEPQPAPYRRVPYTVVDRYCVLCDKPTDWLNNIVIIEKPDKSLRLCLDPQHLNKNIVEENYPIPTLDEITPRLLNKILDLKDGFWQIELTNSCNNLCSFTSPLGTLKFNKLPFGLTIYFDDFIIAADNKEEHDKILQQVMDRARKYNIKFNQNKVQYCQNKVKCLGLLFDNKGISIDTDRTGAIKSLKEPTSKKELQRLFGFINYVRKFVPNLAEMSDPLRNLLKKDVE